MRLEIRYVTSFSYGDRVRESHNALRARPASTPDQGLVSYRVSTDPEARVISYRDYWGTWVDTFGVRRSHDQLTIVADSIVETTEPETDLPDLPTAVYREEHFLERNWAYLQPSRHASWNEDIEDQARGAVAGTKTVPEAVHALYRLARRSLAYAPGATYIGMVTADVLAQGKGVCQDFAHLALALYRVAGIPARYVSGYLYAADQSSGDMPAEAEIEVQTHAWIEVAVPGRGWFPFDPTNPISVGERHVKIGHGRDYDDVLPLRGVYHGDADHELSVSVMMSNAPLAAFQRPKRPTVRRTRRVAEDLLHQQQQQQQQ